MIGMGRNPQPGSNRVPREHGCRLPHRNRPRTVAARAHSLTLHKRWSLWYLMKLPIEPPDGGRRLSSSRKWPRTGRPRVVEVINGSNHGQIVLAV